VDSRPHQVYPHQVDLIAWVYVFIAAVGLWALGNAVRKFVAARSEPSGPARRPALYYLCFGLFFVLQAVGFAGERLGFFGGAGRGAFLVLAFVAAGFALFRFRPAQAGPRDQRE
jgi:hypothetical protein